MNLRLNNPYIKKNLSIAWPLALNALLMQSMLMIDTFLVSPLGEESVAAMGMASAIIAFLLGIIMALANGSQMILSRAYGSRKPENINNAFFAALVISISSALLFWAALSVADSYLITYLTDSEALQQKVLDYLDISVYLILFTALTQTMTALFNSFGKTRIPFTGYLIELPVNCAASYIYIYVLGMGVSGAALGSLNAMTLRAIYLSYRLLAENSIPLTFPQSGKLLLRSIRHHFNEIFPFAANITILAIGITAYQLLFSQLSINEYVAITLIYPWIRIGSQFIVAWSHSAAILVSQDIGSEKLKNLQTNVDTSIDVAVVISCISCLLFIALHFTFPLFYPALAEETYNAISIIAPLYVMLPLIRGYNTVHGNILRAVGKTKEVFKINFTGQWIISLPLLSLLIFHFDVSVFWAFAIQPIEELVKALPFRQLARKTVREFDHEQAEQLQRFL